MLIAKFAECTMMYAHQKNDIHFSCTENDIKKLFGLHILMGNFKFPRVRMYWDTTLKMNVFPDAMPVNKFFKIRNYLHCVNNLTDQNPNDKFWKVRPIYDDIQKYCSTLKKEREISVDEQIAPFKGSHEMKQYLPSKPHPWGFKIFMLCGKSGMLYDFIIYQGKSTEIEKPLLKNNGFGAAVVLYLIRNVEAGHVLYCDNYFNTYRLIQILTDKDIRFAGTVRINRFLNPPFPKIKNKSKRGYQKDVVSSDGVVMTQWIDNKVITMCSNYVGIGETDVVKRWSKKEKSTYILKDLKLLRSTIQQWGELINSIF